MKIKAFKIPDSMYNNSILLYWGGTQDDFISAVKKRYDATPIEKSDAVSGLSCKYAGETGTEYVIWAESHDVLLHEVFHSVMLMLHDAGIQYHQDSNDTQAYYLQHIYGNIIETLKHKGKK